MPVSYELNIFVAGYFLLFFIFIICLKEMSEVFAVELKDLLPDSLFQEFILFVGKKKEERILKFRRRIDAERTLIGDVLIRTIICNQFHIKNRELTFEYNKYGKPFLTNITDFHFNISHSGKWVVCAIDTSPVGIDVECIKSIDFSIAERFFSKKEYSDIMEKEGKERFEYFYDLWTLKESYIKARGKGLSIPLSSFTITKENGDITINSESDELWFFTQYSIGPDYMLSVCSRNNHFPPEINIISPFELADKLPG